MEPPVSENKAGQQPQLGPESHRDNIRFPNGILNLLSVVAYLLLTFNAASSAWRSRRNPSALAFVAFAYAVLVLLFLCLKRFEKLGPSDSPEEKKRLKAAVWVLATALNLAFACRVADVMPPMIAVVVWLMAGSVTVGGFYGLFIYRDGDEKVIIGNHAYSAVQTEELSPEEKL